MSDSELPAATAAGRSGRACVRHGPISAKQWARNDVGAEDSDSAVKEKAFGIRMLWVDGVLNGCY